MMTMSRWGVIITLLKGKNEYCNGALLACVGYLVITQLFMIFQKRI